MIEIENRSDLSTLITERSHVGVCDVLFQITIPGKDISYRTGSHDSHDQIVRLGTVNSRRSDGAYSFETCKEWLNHVTAIIVMICCSKASGEMSTKTSRDIEQTATICGGAKMIRRHGFVSLLNSPILSLAIESSKLVGYIFGEKRKKRPKLF